MLLSLLKKLGISPKIQPGGSEDAKSERRDPFDDPYCQPVKMAQELYIGLRNLVERLEHFDDILKEEFSEDERALVDKWGDEICWNCAGENKSKHECFLCNPNLFLFRERASQSSEN